MRWVLRAFSRRWLLTTVLVVVAMGVMARLGIWQLDRLKQRRAFNARVQAQLDQPVLTLDSTSLKDNLPGMEYRSVKVVGEYDHSQQIAIRNQVRNGQWGVDLLTPLRIAGTEASVLVDRGWIPAEDFQSGNWGKYDEPGAATVQGVIRSSQAIPDFGPRRDPTAAPGDPPLKAWNFVNIPAISQQISYPLLPVYIQEAPDPAWDRLPARTQPQLELTEGPHMGYAIQWFTFAAILGIGYPFFIRRKEREALKKGYPKQFYKEVLVSTNGNGNGHKEEDLEGLRRRQ